MLRTLEAIVDADGNVIIEEPIQLKRPHRAIVTILEESHDIDTALVSEKSLSQDWLRPEEDEAWASLQ